MNENNNNIKIKTVHWIVSSVIITTGCMIWLFTILGSKADKDEVKDLSQKIERVTLLTERIAAKIGVNTR